MRLSDDKLLWFETKTSEEPCGGAHLLGRYVVRVNPAEQCSAYAQHFSASAMDIVMVPRILLLDTARYSALYELEVLPQDGDNDAWFDALSAAMHAGYQPPVEVCAKVAAVYRTLDQMTVIAGQYPERLLPHPCKFMTLRICGVVRVTESPDQSVCDLLAVRLEEFSDQILSTVDRATFDSVNAFIKRVAAALGAFSLMANFVIVDSPRVSRLAVGNISRLTVLNVELTELALSALPPVLAMINDGPEAMDYSVMFRWFMLANLIKAPSIMHQLIAVGFPSFTVRLLKVCWSALGRPSEVAHTETGTTPGLDDKTREEFIRKEVFAMLCIMQMMQHDGDVKEALILSGVTAALVDYTYNRKRMNATFIFALSSFVFDGENANPRIVDFLAAPAEQLSHSPVRLLVGDGITMLDNILMRFQLACTGRHEGSLPQYNLDGTKETESSIKRFYSLEEVTPCLVAASKLPKLVNIILKSTCLADCISALTHLNAYPDPNTRLAGQMSIVKLLTALSFHEGACDAIAGVPDAFTKLEHIVSPPVEGAHKCTFESAADNGVVSRKAKANFRRDVSALIMKVFPDPEKTRMPSATGGWRSLSSNLSKSSFKKRIVAKALKSSARVPLTKKESTIVEEEEEVHDDEKNIQKGPQEASHNMDKSTENGGAEEGSQGAPQTEQHCMISYCWDDQPFVLRLSKELQKRGVKVWVDVESMSGSTLEAMASAVENAYAVIIILSDSYKDSTACRTEAEYAYTLKKKMIPVKNSQQFTATGWLGALMGTKLWVNFGGVSDMQFDQKITMLHTEIGRVAGRDVSVGAAAPPRSTPAVAATAETEAEAGARHRTNTARWKSATKAVLSGHRPVEFTELETAVHSAVSSRLREIFEAVRTDSTNRAQGRGSDAFLNHVLADE